MSLTPNDQQTYLTTNGWILIHTCHNCKGLQQKWIHPVHKEYEIVLRIKKNTARIYQNNNIIAGSFWSYDLDKHMEKHIPKLTT